MKDHIRHLRKDYHGTLLDKESVCAEPLQQFEQWFKEAFEHHVPEPNAMILATVGKNAAPSLRVVLLKEYNQKGFVFYTNYNSRKGKEIEGNPQASILFFWPQLYRQIRIEGIIEKVAPQVSEAYFYERPYESRITAWVSPQSSVISDKKILEEKYSDFEKNYFDKKIPYPLFWGGYCLKPNVFEFWQGQPSRLHDRISYTQNDTGSQWIISRIAP